MDKASVESEDYTGELPNGHIRVDGIEYVDIRLFDAANRGVREMGETERRRQKVSEQLARERDKARSEVTKLERQLKESKERETRCQRDLSGLMKAINQRAEGV